MKIQKLNAWKIDGMPVLSYGVELERIAESWNDYKSEESGFFASDCAFKLVVVKWGDIDGEKVPDFKAWKSV